MKNNHILTKKEIKLLIPHRYPMLFIENIEIIKPGFIAIGKKKLSNHDSLFLGHFPNKPIMPGILALEALAQTASVLIFHYQKKIKNNKFIYFTSISKTKFRKPIIPGHNIIFIVSKVYAHNKIYKFTGKVVINKILHVESIFTAIIKSN